MPQVREYKYLGTPLQIGFEGRHTKMRKQVVSSCSALLRQIGRVDMLGPRQTRRCMELAMAGVMGYFARSTPLRWADCHAIEQVRVRELARRKHTAAPKRDADQIPVAPAGKNRATPADAVSDAPADTGPDAPADTAPSDTPADDPATKP